MNDHRRSIVSGVATARALAAALVAIGGDQAARKALVCSAQAHGGSSSNFWAGQPLTSLFRISAT